MIVHSLVVSSGVPLPSKLRKMVLTASMERQNGTMFTRLASIVKPTGFRSRSVCPIVMLLIAFIYSSPFIYVI